MPRAWLSATATRRWRESDTSGPGWARGGHIWSSGRGGGGGGVALTGLAGRVVAQAVAGQAERFDVFAQLQHRKFPGGALLRTPSLVLGMLYHRLRDAF